MRGQLSNDLRQTAKEYVPPPIFLGVQPRFKKGKSEVDVRVCAKAVNVRSASLSSCVESEDPVAIFPEGVLSLS